MIYDDIERWKTYRFSEIVSSAFNFLEGLDANTPEGECELDGRRLYASVMGYNTLDTPASKLEVHRKYIDIQYALAGTEILVVTPYDELDVYTPYDEKCDAEFLCIPKKRELLRLEMRPGTFAVFFPQDAHFGRIASTVTGAGKIKKVVVKAALSVF